MGSYFSPSWLIAARMAFISSNPLICIFERSHHQNTQLHIAPISPKMCDQLRLFYSAVLRCEHSSLRRYTRRLHSHATTPRNLLLNITPPTPSVNLAANIQQNMKFTFQDVQNIRRQFFFQIRY